MEHRPTYRNRLTEVINDGEVDPRKAAEKVRPDVPEDEVDALVLAALVDAANEIIRSVRRPADSDGHPTGDRYGALKKISSDPTSWPVCPTGREDGWKKLGDCTAEELDMLAAAYEQRAARFQTIAGRYRTLAEKVRAAGVTSVGELPADDIHGVAA